MKVCMLRVCCVDFGGGLMPPYWKLVFDLLAREKQLDLPLAIEPVFPSVWQSIHPQLCHGVFCCACHWIMPWERVRGRPRLLRDICSHSIFRKSFLYRKLSSRSDKENQRPRCRIKLFDCYWHNEDCYWNNALEALIDRKQMKIATHTTHSTLVSID